MGESVTKALCSPASSAVDPCALGSRKSAPTSAAMPPWAKIGAACATRKSAQMLAVLNSVVLSLMDVHHVPNVARQIRRFASHPDEALAWVLDF